jgi:hypothetical protein
VSSHVRSVPPHCALFAPGKFLIDLSFAAGFHVDSFFECADLDSNLKSMDQLEGSDMLRQYDQDLLTEEIAKVAASGGNSNGGNKRKAKVLSDDEDQDTDEDPIEADDDWDGRDDDPIEESGHGWGSGKRLGGDHIEDLSGESPWPLKVGQVVQLKKGATDYEGGPLVPGNTVRRLPRVSRRLLHLLLLY